MKKLGKILRVGFAVLFVVLVVAITFTIGWRPFIGPKKRAADQPAIRTHSRTPGARPLSRPSQLAGLRHLPLAARLDAAWRTHRSLGWNFAGQAGRPSRISRNDQCTEPHS